MSSSGPKLGALWMEEQFHLMSAKLCWHRLCVRRAARTMLGITSRCRRHKCSSSGTSSRQCWLSFHATPLLASPLRGQVAVTRGPQHPQRPGGRLWKERSLLTATGWLRRGSAGTAARWQRRRGGPWPGMGLGWGMGAGMGLGWEMGLEWSWDGDWEQGWGCSTPPPPFIAAVVAGPAPRGGEQRRFRCHSQRLGQGGAAAVSSAGTVPKQHLGGG